MKNGQYLFIQQLLTYKIELFTNFYVTPPSLNFKTIKNYFCYNKKYYKNLSNNIKQQ